MGNHYELRDSGLLVPANLDDLSLAGRYIGQIIRDGKVIDEFEFENKIVNQGLNYLLNAGLQGASAISSWYVGIFQGNYTPVATDTAATIAANSTECSAYTAGVRQAYTVVASTAQSITNTASQASFTFNASETIYGAFLVSTSTINGTSGTLFSAAQFGASKAVASGDQLLLTYVVNASSST